MYTTSVFQILNRAGMPGQQRPVDHLLTEIRLPLQGSEFYMALDSNSSDDTFVIMLHWLQMHFNIGSWPNFVEYYRIPKTALLPGQSFGFRSKNTFYHRIVGYAFISYFESQLPKIEAKHGKDRSKWQGVVNFARIIRNGFAHGGHLKIDNPTAPPETWRNWTYDKSNSGQEFFMTSDGLAIGDIILLFEDLHQELYA
jgi:hypothetical protein